MGGRGSSSGISDKGKKYGTEYHTVAQFGEIKVIRMNGCKFSERIGKTVKSR